MIPNNSAPEVVFNNMGRKYGLSRIKNFNAHSGAAGSLANARAVPALISHDVNHLSRLLQFVHTSDLRKLLTDDPHSFHSLEDKQVVQRVATLIQSRRIVLFELATSGIPEPRRASSKPSPKAEEFVEVEDRKSSSELAINKPPTPKISSQRDEAVINESAQIAVLVDAAKNGAAFCEKCTQQESA